MSKDKKLDKLSPIEEEIQSISSQYKDCMEKKQHFHDLAQKCLGAIEALQKIESKKENKD